MDIEKMGRHLVLSFSMGTICILCFRVLNMLSTFVAIAAMVTSVTMATMRMATIATVGLMAIGLMSIALEWIQAKDTGKLYFSSVLSWDSLGWTAKSCGGIEFIVIN